MATFLLLAALSLLGVVVSAVLFSAAVNYEDRHPESRRQDAPALPPPQFFADDVAAAIGPRVPIEALLLQLERHVRLEQAAAAAFLDAPTAQSLHSPTMSPLVH
jgi:hypothetical protein